MAKKSATIGRVQSGLVSKFGGPLDPASTRTSRSPSSGGGAGAAFILPFQPPNTTGLARRLNPFVHYLAMRWDYDVTPREMLLDPNIVAIVRATKTGIALRAFPSDWGPHIDTNRLCDLSPGLLRDLQIVTDDEVEVVYPVSIKETV